jgi:hypothetical protein
MSGEIVLHLKSFCSSKSRTTGFTSVGLHRQRQREFTHAPCNCLLADTAATVS